MTQSSCSIAVSSRLPYLCAFLAALLFGCGTPVAKVLLGDIGPVTLAGLFYVGSGSGVVAYLLICRIFGHDRHGSEAALRPADLPWIVGIVLFGGFLAPVTLMISLQSTPAATVSLLQNFEAVATAVIAVLFFGEAVGKRTWTALGLITFSCILLSWESGGVAGLSLPALGVLLACTFWGLDNNFSRNVSAHDPLPTVAVKGLGAGSLSLLLAHALGEALPAPGTCLLTMLIGFFSYGGIVSILFLLSLRDIGTARTGSILAVAPFFGVAVAFFLFAAPPDVMFYLALPLMGVGAYLLVTERHSHLHHHEAMVHEHRHRHDDLHHNHEHPPGTPPLDWAGYHSHVHTHEEVWHDHPHVPDIHHRHRHGGGE